MGINSSAALIYITEVNPSIYAIVVIVVDGINIVDGNEGEMPFCTISPFRCGSMGSIRPSKAKTPCERGDARRKFVVFDFMLNRNIALSKSRTRRNTMVMASKSCDPRGQKQRIPRFQKLINSRTCLSNGCRVLLD